MLINGQADIARVQLESISPKLRGWEWEYLYSQTDPNKIRYLRGGYIGKIIFTGDSSLFAVLKRNKGYFLEVYNSSLLKKVSSFKLEKRPVYSQMAFSADKRLIAISSIFVRRAKNKKFERMLRTSYFDIKKGSKITKTICEWSLKKRLYKANIHYVPELRSFVIIVGNKELAVLNIDSGNVSIRKARKGYAFVLDSIGNTVIERGYIKGKLRLVSYNLANGARKNVCVLKNPGTFYVNLHKTRLLLLDSKNNKVKLYGLTKRKLIKEIEKGSYSRGMFAESGNAYALWSPKSGTDGIAIYDLNGDLKMQLKPIGLLKAFKNKFNISFSNKDDYVGVRSSPKSSYSSAVLRASGIWRISDSKKVYTGAWTTMSPDEKYIVTLDAFKKITFRPINYSNKETVIKSITVSPNLKYAVNCTGDIRSYGTVRAKYVKKAPITLINRKTGKVICSLSERYNYEEDRIAHIRFSHDSLRLIVTRNKYEKSVSNPKRFVHRLLMIDMYDTITGKLIKSYKKDPTISKLSYRTRVKMIPGTDKLCFSQGNNIKLFKDNQFLVKTRYHLQDFCFSPDGSLIVTPGRNSVSLWNAKNKKIISKINFASDLNRIGSYYQVLSLAISPDNSRLIALVRSYIGVNQLFLRVCDLRNRVEIIKIPIHTTNRVPQPSISFTEDGKNVIISGLTKAGETIIW